MEKKGNVEKVLEFLHGLDTKEKFFIEIPQNSHHYSVVSLSIFAKAILDHTLFDKDFQSTKKNFSTLEYFLFQYLKENHQVEEFIKKTPLDLVKFYLLNEIRKYQQAKQLL